MPSRINNKFILRLRQARFLLRTLTKKNSTAKPNANTLQIYFDIQSQRIFRRYIFSLAYCIWTAGNQIYFRCRLRFLLRETEPGDNYYLNMPFFKFIFIPGSNSSKVKVISLQETESERKQKDARSHTQLKSADEKGQDHDRHRGRFNVPLTLGPQYLFQHSSWVPARSLLASQAAELRNITVFFSGSMEKPAYAQNTSLPQSGILRRPDILNLLRNSPQTIDFKYITDWNTAQAMLRSNDRAGVRVVDAQTAGFSGDQYRQILMRSKFFLSMPGIASPHTHALAEALACGCIPIIQNASLVNENFKPLQNCVPFTGENDLLSAIEFAARVSESTWMRMSQEARNLYDTSFSPESIGCRAIEAINSDCDIVLRND